MQQTQEFKFRNMIEPISLQSYLKLIFDELETIISMDSKIYDTCKKQKLAI